jgi:hypothetical protein
MQPNQILETDIENMQAISLTDVQAQALEQAQKDLENFRSELETKKYLAEVNGETIKSLLQYVTDEAPWKFTESLGIKEVQKELEACAKSGKLFMNAISYEALYFYLSKIEGKGQKTNSEAITSLDMYLTVLKSLNVVRNVIAQENEKLKEMEFIVASRSEGLDPEVQ